MRKLNIKLYAAAALIVVLALSCIAVNAERSGHSLQGKCAPDKAVTVDVFSPSGERIYRNQTVSDKDGYFSFEIGIDGAEGDYRAKVYCDGEDELREYIVRHNSDVYADDFEKSDVGSVLPDGWTKGGHTAGVENTDNEHKNALVLCPSQDSNVNIQRQLGETVDDGVWRLSFDIMKTSTDNSVYIRLGGTNKDGETFLNHALCWKNNGEFGYYDKLMVRDWTVTTMSAYEADNWYSVNIWLDFDNRLVTFKVGESTASCFMNDGFGKVNNMQFVASGCTGGKIYLDNFRLRRAEVSEMDYLGAPEYLKAPVLTESNLGCIGNVFYDKHSALSVTLKNKDVNTAHGTLCCTVTDESGKTASTEETEISIDAGGMYQYIFEPILQSYGSYTLDVNFKNDAMPGQTEKSILFSVNKVPHENAKMGVNAPIPTDGSAAVQAEQLKAAGMKYVRCGIRWADFEKEKGNYVIPARSSEYINALVERGIEPVMLCAFGNSLYGETPPTGEAISAYAAYCEELARQLEGKVRYFEVWNEYDLAGNAEFNPTEKGPEEYAELLSAAYSAIKRGNPNAQVMGMVTSAVGESQRNWIESVLKELNGEKCFDIISVHPYNLWTSPDGQNNGNIFWNLSALKTLLSSYGLSDVPIWATEAGWASAADGKYDINESTQARYAVQFNLLNDEACALDKILWYTFRNSGTNTANMSENFGLIRAKSYTEDKNTAKPVYTALCAYNDIMADSTFVNNIAAPSASTRNYVYEYQSRRGNTLYAAWTRASEGNTFELELPPGIAVMYDMYGNESVISTGGGTYTLNLTVNPVYIEIFDTYACFERKTSDSITVRGYAVRNDSAKDIHMICGLYDKTGALKNAAVCNAENDNDNFDYFEYTTDYTEGETARAFLWDNELKPVSESVSF